MFTTLAVGLLVVAVLAFLLLKGHEEIRREADRYSWTLGAIPTADKGEIGVIVRVAGPDRQFQAVIAIDRLDLTAVQAAGRNVCPYCLARVPHTIAACVTAARELDPTRHDHAAWWEAYGYQAPTRLITAARAFAENAVASHG